jgi:hypothetical protein
MGARTAVSQIPVTLELLKDPTTSTFGYYADADPTP